LAETSAPAAVRRAFQITIYLATILLIVALVVNGLDYYSTPYTDRPHHEAYRTLRPAGTQGLLYGWIGSAMMILMLTYTLRKRTKFLGQLFTLRNWLDLHIYLGVFGPLFIILHTSFKVQGLVAVSFWSMVVVALSGYFGRYLYLQIPRNIQGNELSLRDVEQVKAILAHRLRVEYGLDDEKIAILEADEHEHVKEEVSTIRAMMQLVVYNLVERRRAHARVEAKLRALGVARDKVRQLARVLGQRHDLQHRIVFLAHVQRLFHYWHVVHKPFAIIMYVIMLVHIGVAIWTGYGWNF
jgi:hypothetical protein